MRVTLEALEGKVVNRTYIYQGRLTICILTMVNGFLVTGESACADPADYNRESGKAYAYEAALDKAMLLEGYLLREQLHQAQNNAEREKP